MQRITQTALLTAVLCVLTMFVSIPVGYGFINLSDMLIMLIACFLPRKYAVFIAAVGCCLADIFLAYGQYAIFTFFIKAIEAYVVSSLQEKQLTLAFVCGGLVMVTGYGLTDIILTGSIYAFVPSISYNAIQASASVILASLLKKPFVRLMSQLNK